MAVCQEVGGGVSAPGGAVWSWLTPPSCSGGEPSRASSAASAGGGQPAPAQVGWPSPGTRARARRGPSSPRPPGARRQRRPEGELELARGGRLGLLVRRRRGGRRRPARHEDRERRQRRAQRGRQAARRRATGGPRRASAARASTAAQRLERRFVAREQLFGRRFDLFDAFDGFRLVPSVSAILVTSLVNSVVDFSTCVFVSGFSFGASSLIFFSSCSIASRPVLALVIEPTGAAATPGLRPAFRSPSATCRLPLWPFRTFPIRIPRTRRAAARTVPRRGRGPVG